MVGKVRFGDEAFDCGAGDQTAVHIVADVVFHGSAMGGLGVGGLLSFSAHTHTQKYIGCSTIHFLPSTVPDSQGPLSPKEAQEQ